MGIIIHVSFALSEDLASKRLVRLLPEHQFGQMPIMLVYPSRRQMSAKVRSFIDYMVAQFPDPQCDPWG
jgi:DNA-binding transcriptional LysR family regulator